jgi:hypothetical protein
MKNQIRYLQSFFYDILNDYGRVFTLIRHSERTVIGKRGFTEEEKEKGIILVFNNQNHKSLQWAEDGSITATLGFGPGNSGEKCYIHCDDIMVVFSPDARVRLDRWDNADTSEAAGTGVEPEKVPDQKIVSLDRFRKPKT